MAATPALRPTAGLAGCLAACLTTLVSGCGGSSSGSDPASPPPAYRAEALPAGEWTALNDTGDVAGQADQGGKTFAALVHASQVVDLGLSAGSRAVALNGKGQAVVNGSGHVYLWQSGTVTDLGRFTGDPNARVAGVALTETGQVLGGDTITVAVDDPPQPAYTADVTRGWTWKDGNFTSVGPNTGSDDFKPVALNAASQFLGTIRFDVVSSPLGHIYNLYGAVSGPTDLLPTTFIGTRLYDVATDIAEDGRVVGYHSAGAAYDEKPEYWTADHQTGPQSLPVASGLMGGKPARVRGARIVGSAYTPILKPGESVPPGYVAGQPRAVLWENGRAIDLNAALPSGSGWVLEYADDVNSSGQILGRGEYNGQPASFLLTRMTSP